MDRKKLQYFISIAECGSFTRAAEALRIAQPALSRQIAILEKEFGVELLMRLGRHVQLTEAGEVLLKHARHIDNSFERVREEMQSRGASPRGYVILGAPPSLGSVIVPTLFKRLRRDWPDITLKVREGTTAFLERSIVEAKLDLALVGEDVTNNRIEDRVLLREDIVAVGQPEHLKRMSRDPGAWKEIPLFMTWQVKRLISDKLKEKCVHMAEPLECDAIHAMKALAIEGCGIVLAPLALFAADICGKRVSAAQIRDVDASRPVVLAVSSVRPQTRAVETVIELITREVRALDRRKFFSISSVPHTLSISLPTRCASCADQDALLAG